MNQFDRKSALAFIAAFGVVSLFGDMAYEGMRGINGQFLGSLGASGAAVGIIAGGGELAGYLIRLVSGRFVQRLKAYWLFSIAGYALTMAAVPAMAFVFNWQSAALFVVLERTGKAIRSPANSTMQSHAGDVIGQGWAFGVAEALDQTGAIAGPLITALVLAHHGDYRSAYAWLALPALMTMLTVTALALRYPFAGNITQKAAGGAEAKLAPAFWLYTASAALLGFGFADFSLMALHFTQTGILGAAAIPILYAVAMGASGAGALFFGWLFDRRGMGVLVPVILMGAVSAPLVFLGNAWAAIAGTVLWGLAIGTQNTLTAASIPKLVSPAIRARAFGIFSAIYGTGWFLGSALLGILYDESFVALAIVAVAAQLIALVPFALALRDVRQV